MFQIRSGNSCVEVTYLAEAVAVLREFTNYGLKRDRIEVLHNGQPLPLVGEYKYTLPAIELPTGPADQVLITMLDEIEHFARRDGHVLKPWQMTRLRWHALTTIGALAHGAVRGLPPPSTYARYEYVDADGKPTAGSLAQLIEAEFHRRFGYGLNGPPYVPGERDTNSRHELHVGYALAQGLPVDPAIVEETLRCTPEYERGWITALLERPFLRGRMPPLRFPVLWNLVERQSGLRLTEENAQAFFAAAALARQPFSYSTLDDALFEAGLLSVNELPPQPQPDEEPGCELTKELAERLAAFMLEKSLTDLDRRRAEGELSKRQHLFQVALHRRQATPRSCLRWAASVVSALRSRDLRQLLETFDTPDTENVVSKRFAEERFGLKVRRLRAAERRAAVFAYCGLDASGQAAWEAAERDREDVMASARQEADAERRTVELASRTSVRYEGRVVTWKQLIDEKIAAGYDRITTRMRGAVPTYWLSTGDRMLRLPKVDGALGYARLALARKAESDNGALAKAVEVATV